MRPQKVAHKEIMEGLLQVLRAQGYDGASLSDLAKASGLKKASLYHRFPGGKQEMTAAVLDYVGEWVGVNILDVLQEKNKTTAERLHTALDNIDELYNRGQSICIFRALTTHTGLELFGQQIQAGMEKYIDAFTQLGCELQMDPIRARKEALQTLIDIQGGLIVSKGLKEEQIFERSLAGIRERYLSS